MQGGRPLILLFSGLFVLAPFAAAQNFDAVAITATPVAGKVQMLLGQGGNIAVSIGDDGTLMVDDQYGALADKIKAKLAELGGSAPSLLVNTHVHPDHTGGNEFFADTATIIAHDNVRRRLADPGARRVPAALPVVTFSDNLTLHYNGEEIRLIHLPQGHTDSDIAVWFVRSSVVHMGDEYVNNGFSFIDTQSGGSLQGFLDNSAHMLELLPDDVRLIPGHGTVSSKAEFATWAADVKESVSLVQASMKAGKDLPTIIAEGLPDKFDSWGQGFIKEDAWITTIYNSGAAQQ